MADLPAYSLHNAHNPAYPVLLSVPHAGRDYPGPLLDGLRVAAGELLRLEDRYADRLVQPAIADGFATIIAHRARAWVDLNRAEHDFDQSMFTGSGLPAARPSAKTRGGLGLVPRRLQSCGELWRRSFDAGDYDERITALHRPYHQAINTILAAMRDRFGVAVLLDVHSMPKLICPAGQDPARFEAPHFVIGDLFGRSAASPYPAALTAYLQESGFRVALNSPYPGDHILGTHGQPARNIHALQLEVDRSLYLDTSLREPSPQLPATARLVHSAAFELTRQASGYGSDFAEAAE